MQLFKQTNIDFLGKRYIFIWISLALNLAGIIVPFLFGLRFGIDFEGGTEARVHFSQNIDVALVREAMDKAKFEGTEIKSISDPKEALIRVATLHGIEPKEMPGKIKTALHNEFPNETIEIRSSQTIGPKVGTELRNKALLAVGLSVIAIMLYLAFRFEFTYGLGAAIGLAHDILVTLALVSIVSDLGIINLEMNQAMIAAFLTVIGFSVHDTVIIFDRIRENIDKHKGLSIVQLMNLSINETLSRTINTVFTVVLVLLTIVVAGGEVLQGFAFTMLVGVITGTYSSIYIASSFVVWYMQHIRKINVEGDRKKDSNKSSLKVKTQGA